MNLPDSEDRAEWLSHPYTKNVLVPQAVNELRGAFVVLLQAAGACKDATVAQASVQFFAAYELCEALNLDVKELGLLLKPSKEKTDDSEH